MISARIYGESAAWWPKASIFLLALLSLMVLFYLTLARGIEPYSIIATVGLMGIAGFMIVKTPLVLVGGLLFVGVLKTKAAEGISVSDPTFILLALVTASILARVLFLATRRGQPLLGKLFAGQGGGLVIYLLFLSVVAGSYLYAPATHYGSDKVLRLCTINFILFSSPLVLLRDETDFRNLVRVFVVFSFVLAVVTMVGLFVLSEADRGEARTRIGEGLYIGTSILILFYYKLVDRFGKTVAIVGIPLLTTAIVASLARGPFVSLMIVMGLSLIMVRASVGPLSRRSTLFAFLLTVAICIAALIWIHQVPSASRTFSQKGSELEALSDLRSPGGTAGMRLDYYRAAVAGFIEKPILGWGAGAWPIYYWGLDKRTYPHNIFLETAFEQGLIGLLIFVALVVSFFRKISSLLRVPNGQFAFLLPVGIYCLAVTMFSGDITAKELWFWFGVVFAAARIVETRIRQERQRVFAPTCAHRLTHQY